MMHNIYSFRIPNTYDRYPRYAILVPVIHLTHYILGLLSTLTDNKNALYWRTGIHFENVKKNTSKIEASGPCLTETMSINIAIGYVEQIENNI